MKKDEATVRSFKMTSVVREPAFRLAVQSGPDQGVVFTLEGTQAPRVLLGTSPTCDFRLSDPQVSRRHLSLELSKGCVRVTDLGSTNGTRTRGVVIREAFLYGGETLELGGTILHVSIDEDAGTALVSDEIAFGRYIGQSVAMRRLYPLVQKLAAAVTTGFIIEGETGTGKELMAEVIHENGARRDEAFVTVDCPALSVDDADEVLWSAFVEANRGTLVLDEVGELDAAVQSKLLRIVERGEVQPPLRGGRRREETRSADVDVRIICTTKRDLDREVAEGRFRDDLYYRLAVARLELPPLRRRREDIGILARHFWEANGGVPDALPMAALARFDEHPWPGNVRELENAVSRWMLLGNDAPVPAPEPAAVTKEAALQATSPDFIDTIVAEALPLAASRQKVIDEFERRYVSAAYERNGKNVTKAAEASGIARRYFRALRAKLRDD